MESSTEILSLHTLLRNASVVSPNGSKELRPSINGIPFSGEGTILQNWKLACEINRMRPPNTVQFSSLNSRGFAKKTIRIGIPVDKYPTEEMMRQFPGMEHLYEPLHILVKAKLPKDTINLCLTQAREVLEAMLQPVDESEDILKQEQLRELAILNGKVIGQRLAMSSSLAIRIPEDI